MRKLWLPILVVMIVAGGWWAADYLFRKTDQPVGNDMIQIVSPRKNQAINNPWGVIGRARGSWFFEATFPIVLLDANHGQIGPTIMATTDSNWMTDDWVPFTAEVRFDESAVKTKTGYLLFKQDNPSGLVGRENQFELPVKFK